jgi:hypothetical protein
MMPFKRVVEGIIMKKGKPPQAGGGFPFSLFEGAHLFELVLKHN